MSVDNDEPTPNEPEEDSGVEITPVNLSGLVPPTQSEMTATGRLRAGIDTTALARAFRNATPPFAEVARQLQQAFARPQITAADMSFLEERTMASLASGSPAVYRVEVHNSQIPSGMLQDFNSEAGVLDVHVESYQARATRGDVVIFRVLGSDLLERVRGMVGRCGGEVYQIDRDTSPEYQLASMSSQRVDRDSIEALRMALHSDGNPPIHHSARSAVRPAYRSDELPRGRFGFTVPEFERNNQFIVDMAARSLNVDRDLARRQDVIQVSMTAEVRIDSDSLRGLVSGGMEMEYVKQGLVQLLQDLFNNNIGGTYGGDREVTGVDPAESVDWSETSTVQKPKRDIDLD